MDICGPILGKYVLCIVDYHSRVARCHVMDSRSADGVLEGLKEFSKEVGKPEMLISDNALEFAGDKIKKFCMHEKIGQYLSTPYHHGSTGRVERFIRTLRNMVEKMEGGIKQRVKTAERKYNESWHSGVGNTPQAVFDDPSCLTRGRRIQRKKRHSELQTGDDVMVKREDRNKGRCEPKFVRGGCVARVLGNDTYEILQGGKYRKYHYDQLKSMRAVC